MELPRRLFKVRFSQELPAVHVGLNVLVHRDNYDRALVDGKLSEDLVVGVVEGEIGESLHTVIAPTQREPVVYSTFQRACKVLRELGKVEDDRPVPCLVADHLIASSQVKHFPELRCAWKKGLEPGLRLTVRAAVHLDEPRLLTIVDGCVNIMDHTKFFERLYRSSAYADQLRDNGCLDT